MVKDILIEVEHDQTRLALMEDDTLSEFYVERKGREKLVGNIYVGRVANILPGMQAAFVDIGMEKNAFLFAGDIRVDASDFGGDAEAFEEHMKSLSIRKMLKMGQEILVQITKEPVGAKGPRITSHITLPGRMAVLLPTVGYIGVSRRIEDEEERARLRDLAERLKPEGMGLIVRTAAEGAEAADFQNDIEYLTRLWHSLSTRARHIAAPALLHRDESLVYRSIRDMLTEDVRAIWIDDESQYASAREAAAMLSPELADRVALYQEARPLFERYRVNTALEKALSRKVWLKSGGYLIFDFAEALTVIDVNTGKYVGSHSLSDTVFEINCEAVYEIARQLRLRDIGGIIVIDFIDMDQPEQREQLLSLLRQQLKKDRTRTNLVGLTGLGLVEMTRKKVHQPIHTQLKRLCPVCAGSGMILSEETIAYQALGDLRAHAANVTGECWLITASPAVAGQLLLLGGVSQIHAYVLADHAFKQEQYEIQPVNEHSLPPKARPLPRPL